MAYNPFYHERTGQVYTETSATVKSMVPTWMSACTGRIHRMETYRHKSPGAPSLLNMSFQSLAWNGFDLDTLEYLPWFLADKFYRWLKTNDLVSFKSWLAFRNAFPDSKVIDRDYSLHIPSPGPLQPSGELPLLTKHLNSLPQTTLTYLCLQHLCITAVNLMSLMDIPNLTVLFLQQHDMVGNSGIHDHFMGNWRRAISEKNAFPKLGVMVFRGFLSGYSTSFSCFSAFPKLQLCNFEPIFRPFTTQRIHDTPPRGGNVGDWEVLPRPDPPIPSYETPEGIQRLFDRTIHEKMKLWEEVAARLLDLPDAETSGGSVFVSHGGRGEQFGPDYSASRWYIRRKPRIDTSLRSTKRAGDEWDTPDARERPKKRGIRRQKFRDVGDMLGGFME